MKPCSHLSDRMPDVAAGRMRWSTADQQHLLECPECAAEWRLVTAAAVLGRPVERSLDAQRIAARVQAELRRAPSTRPRFRPVIWLLPLAAAAALALLLVRSPVPAGPGNDATEPLLLPELETLSVAQLETMLQLLPAEPPADSLRSLDDLTEEEMASVLQNLEG